MRSISINHSYLSFCPTVLHVFSLSVFPTATTFKNHKIEKKAAASPHFLFVLSSTMLLQYVSKVRLNDSFPPNLYNYVIESVFAFGLATIS
jgi:hypothetical protein